MRFAWLLVALGACSGKIDGGSPAGDDDDMAPVDAAPAINTAVARAMTWVEAKVPYCQAANHEHDGDADCASTCTRPDNPDWDPYRSDCSGLVSYAWGLPAPGRVTGAFAPFDKTVSEVIEGADLQAGDAVNNDHHIMLFEDWIDVGTKAHFIEEPGCSSSQPYAREVIATVTISGSTVTVQYRGDYTAIRQTP
jgi:hypothetical protein